ncbi:hypothetical protein [Halomonas salina]|uniref:Uncharacterized protein n=1 Tax=Halomonas salina TaxID=42565 RepID=A0ABR4WV12_9GAMM|nr:hypothetical protein [Halomonas salina]KGE78280.1 hypothetical protein FP66_04610 [Halomonas salina]
MGKGRVLAAHGEGRYTIEIVEDRVRAESARALAVQLLAELDGRINDMDRQISAAQANVDAAAADQDAAIEQYRLAMTEAGESGIDLAEHSKAVLVAARERDRLRTQQRQIMARRAVAQSRIDRVDALPPLRRVDTWCADYTEDLSGDVATAEVPGEIGQVIIQPGFEDGATWSGSADGAMQPALAGTPASVFYNLAMMPGWQRWRPTFRIATISNIDNDLCDITLDPAASSQQGLPVNAQGSYSGVPIMYMDCNGDAFEDGDRALVAFSGNTGKPVVVGFETKPRECRLYEFDTTVASIGGSSSMMTAPGGIALPFRVKNPVTVVTMQRYLSWGGVSEYGEIEAFILCEVSEGKVITNVLDYFWHGNTPNWKTRRYLEGDGPELYPGKNYAFITYDPEWWGAKAYRDHFSKKEFFEKHDWLEQAFPEVGDSTLALIFNYLCEDPSTCNLFDGRPERGDDIAAILPGRLLSLLNEGPDLESDTGYIEPIRMYAKRLRPDQ